MDKISVIIPTYNVEKYVEDAILSILNQTYENLEIIIVDDASTDNTLSILKELQKKDDRIKLFHNKTNKKIAETLNYAIGQSHGEFIARMDGDDISYSNRLEILYNFLNNNSQFDLVGSQTVTINEFGETISFSKLPLLETNIYKGLKYRMATVLHIWLARKNVYDKLKEYRISSAEDYDFLLRLISNKIRFTNVPDYLYKVRVRSGNTTSSQGLKQILSANYAYKLYKERKSSNSTFDSYTFSNLKKNTTPNKISNLFFKTSAIFMIKAIHAKNNKIELAFFLILSIVFSPILQFRYLYRRYKIKKLT